MTRLRLTTGPVALFGAVFVVALVALLPLRLVLGWFDLDRTRIAAREATGSVWFGALREVEAGQLALGDLGAALSPWPLFVGRARIDLDGGTATRVHGAIGVSRHAAGIDDMTATIATGAAFAPLPIGAIDLEDASVRFASGRCESASGRVKATMGGEIAGFALPASLSGEARCDGGALLLPLASQAGTERVALRIAQTGRYTAEFRLQPSDAATAAKLALVGFQQGPGGYVLVTQGKF